MSVPIIFISYSHDSDDHRNWVAALSERLRKDGFETRLDQYVNGTPDEGWPRWMLNRLDEATHVLVVCTETYYRRFRGHEVPGRGKGVDWEGALITQELYDSRSWSKKFVPVLRASGDAQFIPEPLRGATHYVLDSEARYQALLCFLAGSAGIEPGPLGSLQVPTRTTVPPLDFPPGDGGYRGGNQMDETTRAASTPPPIHSPGSSIASPIALEPWQAKLQQRLADQLRDSGLDSLVREFVRLLRAHDPGLSGDAEQIAAYLVNGPGDRYTRVSLFLLAARKHKPDQASAEPAQQLLALVLQTLIRQCRDHDNHAITRIPAELLGTVELVGATRATVPRLPAYGDSEGEHRNGQRDALLRHVGYFSPETGEWEAEPVCLAIARDLLISLGYSSAVVASFNDPLNILRGRLKPYDVAPEDSPLHGIVVERSAVHNPAQVEAVASRLKNALGNLFAVYVYGPGQDEPTATQLADWLHAAEEDIHGLVSSYHADISPDQRPPTHQSTEASAMSNQGINIDSVGTGATVNINTGTQTDAQIGQGNIRLAGSDAVHLLQLLGDLRNRAQRADDVDKRAYAEIAQASDAIEAELKKPEGADKSALARARDILGPFKDVATIASAIEKITTVLGPLLI